MNMPFDHAIDPEDFREPVPRCVNCSRPMITVVEYLARRNGEPMKLIRWRCEDVGGAAAIIALGPPAGFRPLARL